MTTYRTPAAKFRSVPKPYILVALNRRGKRTLGEKLKSTLKIDTEFGILVGKNFNSSMRIGVILLSLLTTIRLKSIKGYVKFYTVLKILLWERGI